MAAQAERDAVKEAQRQANAPIEAEALERREVSVAPPPSQP